MRWLLFPAALLSLMIGADVAGPAQTVQLPVTAIVSQIHNAPGWLPSTSYSYTSTRPYVRVNAGAGWTPGTGTWNPGQPLAAYQLDASSPVPCTSASSGSGPSGTGQRIADGTCKWDYLSNTDYVSLTGWNVDNQKWVSGTTYAEMAVVTSGSPLYAYGQVTAAGCTSTIAPSGPGTGSYSGTDGFQHSFNGDPYITEADGCTWAVIAEIGYSSQRSYIPTETVDTACPAGPTCFHVNMNADYVAEMWDDRTYQAGQNMELDPIRSILHYAGNGEGQYFNNCYSNAYPGTAGANNSCYRIIMTTAPGESFRDNMTPSTPLGPPSAANGVLLYSNSTAVYYQPALFVANDFFESFIGLQFDSVNDEAIEGTMSGGNQMLILDDIIEGGSSDQPAISVDTSSTFANDLILSRGSVGVYFKYAGVVVHSTIVDLAPLAGSSCVQIHSNWMFAPVNVSDTACFGFSHQGTYDTAGCASNCNWNAASAHNVTDVAAGDSGTSACLAYTACASGGATVNSIPGTTFGASAAAAFVNPASDWRNPGSGPLYGTGALIGYFQIGCPTSPADCPNVRTYNMSTQDIIGTVRPQAHGVDVGAWQYPN